jgi:cellulose biosynthesis protein BcsQ
MESELKKNNQGKEKTYPKIYSMHSQKGVVGKTSIALAIAGWEALLYEKKVLLIDADLTGICIKEAMQRKKNKGETEPLEYVFINDLILASPGDFGKYTPVIPKNVSGKEGSSSGFSHFYYESQEDSRIFFAPSSPHYKDIMQIIPLISQEDYLHFFRHRFEDIVVTAIKEGFEVVIFDLPPGFHGLSKTICDMMFDQIIALIKREEIDEEPTRLDILFHANNWNSKKFIESRVIFVTTSDKPDYNALIPLFCSYMREENQKKFFCWKKESKSEKNKRYPYNKLIGSVDFIFNKVKAKDGEVIDASFVMKDILGDLSESSDTIDVDNLEDVKELIEKRLKELGAVPCENISDFDLKAILSTIKNLCSSYRKEEKPDRDFIGEIGRWCINIAKTLDIADLGEMKWIAKF